MRPTVSGLDQLAARPEEDPQLIPELEAQRNPGAHTDGPGLAPVGRHPA
ncbi:hypothetical protein [Micromonospora sp. CP22]|nr:hypothetical protein [Micromonospora sp. CP22]